jgi:hypothetical protein
MDLNKILFPSPKSTYTPENLYNELIYVPREEPNKFIPCLYLPYTKGSCKILLYFHGNAEDVGLAYELLEHLKNTLKVSICLILIGSCYGYGIS